MAKASRRSEQLLKDEMNSLEIRNKVLERTASENSAAYQKELARKSRQSAKDKHRMTNEVSALKRANEKMTKEMQKMCEWARGIVERIDLDEFDLHTDRLREQKLCPPESDSDSH